MIYAFASPQSTLHAQGVQESGPQHAAGFDAHLKQSQINVGSVRLRPAQFNP
jgi:hypothetical protein